ncbi:uncharacterized protein LOC111012702 [Momordica charantia]|uniref:Uncharacterized protein LOC111012702 n=1 Tax=Momordica charantia TaxID=3673 RepID=A0A6J1CM20_MOMCH|nr:uncharacterized protein LOC111012702 [Momordica charantia]
MGITRIVVLLYLLSSLCQAATLTSSSHSSNPNRTDLEAAIEDMRAKSFYGFAILLQMLNATTQLALRDITFFIPRDAQLSNISIAVGRLEAFVFSHFIAMPLQFSDLIRFPTGSMVPSGVHNRMIRVHNHGRAHFLVNNAEVTVPNVCATHTVKCHGVNRVIDYGHANLAS